ncbi:MAG TPA: hypothetical protein DCY12_07690 [Candidatus Atribacteria bacterium]|nr:hypothetical protein [Candidatus Atribacteria bacterium]
MKITDSPLQRKIISVLNILHETKKPLGGSWIAKKRIHTTSRFGKILEFSKSRPVRFSDIINYDSFPLTPSKKIFIKGKITSVH